MTISAHISGLNHLLLQSEMILVSEAALVFIVFGVEDLFPLTGADLSCVQLSRGVKTLHQSKLLEKPSSAHVLIQVAFIVGSVRVIKFFSSIF